MRLYLDSADISQVKPLFAWGAFAGITTNPIILRQYGLTPDAAAKQLTQSIPGDVFIQLTGEDPDELEKKIRELNELSPSKIMIKIPPTPVGLEVIDRLRDERIWTAATALFSPAQALLAANAGADILIPFFSRIAESDDAEGVVRDIQQICERRGGRPRVLVASLKSVADVLTVANIGVWGATIPVDVAAQMLEAPGTASALERFKEASEAAEE